MSVFLILIASFLVDSANILEWGCFSLGGVKSYIELKLLAPVRSNDLKSH